MEQKEIKFPAIIPGKLNGSEEIHYGAELIGQVADFWAWAHSDLIENAERGSFAEYIVHRAVHASSETRVNWDKYDVLSPEGIAIEVKTSGYLQSWAQEKLSSIVFSIKPTFGWDSKTNTYSDNQARQSAVYVFCLLACQDQNLLDPLNLSQWEFYVLPTKALNEKAANQKSVSLSKLISFGATKTDYPNLRDTIIEKVKECDNTQLSGEATYTGTQFAHIVYEAAQWLNEVLDEYVYRSGKYVEPWDEKEQTHNYIAERYYLISAIHHTIKYLRIIDNVISAFGDSSINAILPEIYKVVPWTGIKNLRDMNEHREEYLIGRGKNQGNYQSEIKIGDSSLWTDASWTIGISTEDKLFFGNIDQISLVDSLKGKKDQLLEKLQELFYATYPLGGEQLNAIVFKKDS